MTVIYKWSLHVLFPASPSHQTSVRGFLSCFQSQKTTTGSFFFFFFPFRWWVFSDFIMKYTGGCIGSTCIARVSVYLLMLLNLKIKVEGSILAFSFPLWWWYAYEKTKTNEIWPFVRLDPLQSEHTLKWSRWRSERRNESLTIDHLRDTLLAFRYQ